MTSTFTKFISIALGCNVLFTSCERCKEKKDEPTPFQVTIRYLPSEKQLNLTLHEVERLPGIANIGKFKSYVKRLAATIPDKIVTIKSADFNSLIAAAQGSVNPCCTNTTYITAIKLYLGLVQNSVSLLYQPLLLCEATSTPGANAASTFTVCSTGSLYTYAAGGFSPTTDTSILTDYLTNVRLKDTLNGIAFHPHNGRTDIHAHTKSLIFPFQVIRAVIEENANVDSVTIWNSIREVPVPNVTLVKHSVLIARKDMPGLPLAFTNKFANLAHLCPPNCVSLEFRIN